MKPNRIIALYILCFAAMVPVFLSAAFLGGRLLIRITMLHSLESEKVITLRLDSTEIKWYQVNHELIIDGRMFDVKTMSEENGYLIVSGLFDDMETEMNEQLEKNHSSGKEPSKTSHSIYQVCLGIVGIKNPLQGQISGLAALIQSFLPPSDQLRLYNPDIIPLSPPPES